MSKVANASTMHEINRSAVLQVLRERQPISRSDVAAFLGLSAATVTRIVEDLMADGLIEVVGSKRSTGGRPGTLLKFDGSKFLIVGIDLGGTKIYGTVADLEGNIKNEVYEEHKDENNKVEFLCAFIQKILSASRASGQVIKGIGIGVPGITLSHEGIVTWAPSLNWRDVPLRKIIEARFELPVYVENDVNLASLGEFYFGSSVGSQSSVYLAIGTGIGAGIIVHGKLLKGFNQAAGEVGFMVTDPGGLQQTYDDYGHFESQASGTGIGRKSRKRLKELGSTLDGVSASQIFAAAQRQECWAEEIVKETLDLLALAIANMAALLDPEVIVLSGGVSVSLVPHLPGIRQRLQGVVPYLPIIKTSNLGSRGAVMGAIVLVMNGTLPSMVINRI